ncbi:hypothetical protein FK530_06245 [Tsukamurella conjunctivitidis]|uniref:Uncharacterized protein n=1 Tax=Tsukamurella conjunctivitidis TaxID=2592068 RepID=A0A5C5S638_9ACTN|nr:hypothetical protein [Tsukamurella conjunctivitidis]TWS30113.1 hypothetical protein FK530_06245 [Tsukamurella conjunctivitidis]
MPAKAGYVVVRLQDGTTAHARRSRDGSFIVVEPEEKPSSSDLSESSYRELMAVLEMEDTGRSRRGSL